MANNDDPNDGFLETVDENTDDFRQMHRSVKNFDRELVPYRHEDYSNHSDQMKIDGYDQLRSPTFCSKFNAIMKDTDKSPVTKLNEIVGVLKKPLDFKLVSVEGEVHSPCFIIEARSDNLTAMGRGLTKKVAKREAAIALLNQMDININKMSINPNHYLRSLLCENNNVNLTYNNKSHENSISQLQELCMVKHWVLPIYTSSHINNSYYSVECTLMNFKTQGDGITKQAAKRVAAQHMYDHIKHLIITKSDDYNIDSKYQPSSQIISNNNNSINDEVDTKQVSKLQITPAKQLSNKCYEDLKLSEKSGLNELKDIDIDSLNTMNAIEILRQISDEECFNISYRVVSPMTSIKVIVLLELSLKPAVVHAGTGQTVEEAKGSCARTVLVYLKLLLLHKP